MLAAICHGIKWKDRLDLCDCVYLFSITSCRGCYLPQWPAFSFFKFFFFFSFEKLNCTALRCRGKEAEKGLMEEWGNWAVREKPQIQRQWPSYLLYIWTEEFKFLAFVGCFSVWSQERAGVTRGTVCRRYRRASNLQCCRIKCEFEFLSVSLVILYQPNIPDGHQTCLHCRTTRVYTVDICFFWFVCMDSWDQFLSGTLSRRCQRGPSIHILLLFLLASLSSL